MQEKKVIDIMIPAEEYPTVNRNMTMIEGMLELQRAQENAPPGRPSYRALLVTDDDGKIVGKAGYLAFLKALEPKYETPAAKEQLRKANLDTSFIDNMLQGFNYWNESFIHIEERATTKTLGDIMHPVRESIDSEAPITEALHKLIVWDSISILVSKGSEIVGIIRLSDLYNEIRDYIKNACCDDQ